MSQGAVGVGRCLLTLADSDRTPAAPILLPAFVAKPGSLFRLCDGRPLYRLRCDAYVPWAALGLRGFRARLRGRRALAARALGLQAGETITLVGRWRNKVFYADAIVQGVSTDSGAAGAPL